MFAQPTHLLVVDLRQSLLVSLGARLSGRGAYTCHGWRPRMAEMPVLGFNGQPAESIVEGYFLGHGHRMYSPLLMRFHVPDRSSPFGKGGLNCYAYCNADPLNRHDPTGRFFQWANTAAAMLDTVSGHAENILGTLFRRRPQGILGYARTVSDIGYVGAAAGFAASSAGYSVGATLSSAGMALVSVGNAVRATHGAVTTLRRSKLFSRSPPRAPNVALQPLETVVIQAPYKTLPPVSRPEIRTGQTGSRPEIPADRLRSLRDSYA
jgi:RHS repeat-associated protein